MQQSCVLLEHPQYYNSFKLVESLSDISNGIQNYIVTLKGLNEEKEKRQLFNERIVSLTEEAREQYFLRHVSSTKY
jgi:hypothetical protein